MVSLVLTIGTFYIQQSLAKSSYPQFVIETKSGDESEIKSLEIDAGYRNEGIAENLLITSEGTEYRQDLSLVREAFDYYEEPGIKRLQDEFRNFMRGKVGNPSLFYEDEDRLIYADVGGDYGFNSYEPNQFEFEIAVLNKDSNDKTSFKLMVPNNNQYQFIHVEDVQFVNDELLVITHNNLRFNESNVEYIDNNSTEIHVYSFDIAEEKLLKDETIEFPEVDKENEQMVDMFMMRDEEQMVSNKSIVLTTEIGEERMVEEGIYAFEPVDFQLIRYHLETGEQFELDLPEEVKEGYRPEIMKDDHVYFKKISDSQLDIIRYNVETQEIDVKQTFDLPLDSENVTGMFGGGIQGGTSRIDDDKVYYVSTLKSVDVDATVFVGDIETGDILYEGSIEHDPTSTTPPNKYQLELYYFNLK